MASGPFGEGTVQVRSAASKSGRLQVRALVLVVLLALLTPSVVGFALPSLTAAGSDEAASTDADSAPHSLLLLENRGPTASHELTIRGTADGAVVFDETILHGGWNDVADTNQREPCEL